MDLGLRGKVAVILAASSGIGRGIATVLAQEGCNIAICAREASRLAGVADEIRSKTDAQVLAETADVANGDSLNRFFDQAFGAYGKIDILVNNSGGSPVGKCLELTDKQYQQAYDLTLMSVIRSCRRVVPSMLKQGWGRIINVESTSVKCALENMALSNVFRSGVAAFSKTLSMEYARGGVRTHTILSGPFLTNRVRELGIVMSEKKGISFEQWMNEAEAGTALGRFGDPLEYGALVAFLASERSDYMTGTCIAIDGGALKTIC